MNPRYDTNFPSIKCKKIWPTYSTLGHLPCQCKNTIISYMVEILA